MEFFASRDNISCGIFLFLNTLMSHYSTAMTVTCEAVNSARLSEDLRRTKMSCLVEMQLFEEKSLNRRTMLIQKKEEMGETMMSLTKKFFFYYWKQIFVFTDDGEAEDITPDFTVIHLFTRLLVILSTLLLSRKASSP